MKKIFILLMLTCSVGFTKANPITCPPVISEFYLVDSSHWYLELSFLQDFCTHPSTLDGCRITTSSGTFYFKNGILTTDSIIVITQDSLLSPMQIKRSGDFISIEDSSGYWYPIDQLYFGNISGSQISAPKQGQSVVNYGYSCWNTYLNIGDVIYMKVKDNHPTIGFNAFMPYNPKSNTTVGTFTGIVYDSGHQPVHGIGIGNSYYIVPVPVCENFFKSTGSDTAGRFTIPEYSGRYYVDLFFPPYLYSSVLLHSSVDIEPDSINYYEFTIDTLLTGINSNSFQKDIDISCFPNPTTGETTISFGMPADRHYTKSLIKIYNVNGEMVRILPVSAVSSQSKYSIKWDGLCFDNLAASGTYYCNLELDGQKVASNKIIIAK